ncbi:FkbM family methyltransferase [Cohaesibacter haloalkalitolerans]|uniref:FkbM family methyltransferase n=1 Tax=Cohaesibacter haloalkalitolerans TaxID=1162980 RepID=UPI000E6567AA|nr:FkbM family methyltransferase [Cohaesibacter haloalkalitolerans]
MSEREQLEPAFGTYTLPRPLAALRNFANDRGASYYDKRIASLIRRLLYSISKAPYDVTVFRNQRVRLFPKSNRCEKRAFVGLSSWDDQERAAIAADIARHDDHTPFVFLDCGANVGLYSLFARDETLARGKIFRGMAIEPDPINQKRLAFNLAASGAREIILAPVAVGRENSTVQFVSAVSNRGEAHVLTGKESLPEGAVVSVPMRPLLDLLGEHGFDHIDVMKIDVEGHEIHALEPFFKTAPRDLWPRKILIEVGRSQVSEALKMCLSIGYKVEKAININAYLSLEAPETRLASSQPGN